MTVTLDSLPLSLNDVEQVARHAEQVEIASVALDAMNRSRAVVEAALDDGEAHYGINTGFGSLARTRIDRNELTELQHNLLRSHAAGVGEALADEVVRGMLLLLAASLCRGLSGVRPELAQRIVDLLNAGVTPVVPFDRFGRGLGRSSPPIARGSGADRRGAGPVSRAGDFGR